jgi:serine/threonine-protein kinase
MVEVGEVLAERYALGDVLGAGGSGVVRRAHDTLLHRDVAIKQLRAGQDDDVLRARLQAEARLAGSLHHPGVAEVFDYLEVDGQPHLVLQLVEGTSLWQLLRDRRTLPVREVLDLVAQVADALEAAHGAGIVHRDLKPSNVIVTAEGRAVLVDFGIARSADAEPLTSTGTIVGTVDYISPEQCSGHTATPASDLWSLGMLAYECLTGRKPFRRESPVATALAVLHDDLPPVEGQPPGVAQLVAGLVVRDPGSRLGPAGLVAETAREILAALTEETEPVRRVLPPAPDAAAVAAARERPWRRALRSRRTAVAAALVAASLVVIGGVAARSEPDRVPDVGHGTWAAADTRLARAEIDHRRVLVDDPSAETGDVLGQSPAPGSRVDDDTVVVVRVASGQTTLHADDVTGLGYARAARKLVALGLVPSRGSVVRSDGDGTVVAARPAGRLPVGATVELVVAVAPAPSYSWSSEEG